MRNTETRNSFYLTVQKNSKKQSDHYAERNFNDGVFDRIDQRLPDLRICKRLCIVGQSDKSIALSEIAGLTERLIHRIDCRIKVKNDQSDHGRRYKGISP